jgi:hypothetical protein
MLIVDKLKPMKVEKTLHEYLASLSINPKEPNESKMEPANSVITAFDVDIHTIFEESFQQTVRELSTLIKEKLKLINVK